MRHFLGGFLVAAPIVAALPRQIHAGGWASVELDAPPSEVRAGQPLRIGFMVKQHGVTPIHFTAGMEVKPLLSARSLDTSETVAARAVKSELVGHFVAEVTFPSAGRWEWEITPEPFAGTKFPALSVLGSGAAISAASRSTISAATEAQANPPAQLQARAAGDSSGNDPVRIGIAVALFVLAAGAAAVVAGVRPRYRRARAGE